MSGAGAGTRAAAGSTENRLVIKRHHLRSEAQQPVNNEMRSALRKQPMRQFDKTRPAQEANANSSSRIDGARTGGELGARYYPCLRQLEPFPSFLETLTFLMLALLAVGGASGGYR